MLDRWMDLSLPIRDGMPVYPGDPPVSIRVASRHETHGYELRILSMGTHTGTHLDAPVHFVPGGPPLSDLPPEAFLGRAFVVQTEIMPPQPDPAEWARLRLPPLPAGFSRGDILLLSTGWETRAGTTACFDRIPRFVPGTGRALVAAGVRILGLDLPTVREEGPDGAAMHRELLGAGILLVEGLVHLEGLLRAAGTCPFHFQALPLPIEGGDGCPVRALAGPLPAGRSRTGRTGGRT